MAFGVTPEGFRSKTLEEIKAELEAELRALFGDAINLSSSSVWGQFVGIFSSKVRELWELGASVYASQDPDAASDAALEAVAALTGTLRQAATRSVVTASVTVEPGTYAAGSLVANVSGRPAIRFRNRDAVVNGTGGPLVVPAVFEAENTGPVEASAGTLSAIATPVSGWSAITNAADAVPGANAETDEELRARRLEELTLATGSALDAIRVALLRLEDETGAPLLVSVTMFENDTDVVDGLGLPPHSFEALVHDGTLDGSGASDEEIGAELWRVKPGGIRAHGSTEVTVQDSQGTDRVVRFSRPEVSGAHIEIDLETDEDLGWNPATSPQLVAEAVAAWGGANLRVGGTLRLAALNVPIFSVAGVVDVLEIRAGFAASPVGTVNLEVGPRELIDLDTSRITVSVP